MGWADGQKTKARSSFLHFIQSYGFVVLFCGGCLSLYANSMRKKDLVASELKQKIHRLELLKESILAEQQDLMLQISSFDDPAWMEMVLKKGLGVTSEGQTKVYFKQEE